MLKDRPRRLGAFLGLLGLLLVSGANAEPPAGLLRSARSGVWSAPETWEGGKVPMAGARVQVRPGHSVVYDLRSETVIRSIHVGGILRFATDRDTRLDVGLIKIQAGEDASETGFDCAEHIPTPAPGQPRPALEVGMPGAPVAAGHTALIRLTYVPGLDRDSAPAIVNCGGRMDLHGAPMSRTWLKLERTAPAGAQEVSLAEPVTGWRAGDRLIVTTTQRQRKSKGTLRASVRDLSQTEERTLQAIEGSRLTLDKALQSEHLGEGIQRAEVANLSRSVVIESADPDGVRGHTMYHHGSSGSISYAELRHLGKEGLLGRYSLHFHRVGDTMRGSSVVGASIWDSANRWLTVHGTDYLVVRDCVGYRSKGHGFFLEDGTEAYNVLDRNLAVQACRAKPLPDQVVASDHNEGAGFWWANSHNTFTRNVAAECDEYGFRFDAPKDGGFELVQPVRGSDGEVKPVDIRTLPFIRFEDNEAHSMRRHAFNFGGGVGAEGFGNSVGVNGVGPDVRRPFVIRSFRVWDTQWGAHLVAPTLLVDGLHFDNVEYALWRSVFNRHAYRGLQFDRVERNKEYYGKGIMPRESDFPGQMKAVDDLPPATVITRLERLPSGALRVTGTTSDNGPLRQVVVNGKPATLLTPGGPEWESTLPAPTDGKVTAHGEDAAGNVEKNPHTVSLGG